MDHPAQLAPDLLLEQCEVRRQRRSGPGGQHRNKVETGIFIRHLPSGVRAEATEGRSQEQNRKVAVHRLRVNLAVQIRQNRDARLNPSETWGARIRGGQLQVNADHQDFPAMLAEALDVLASFNWAMQPSASHLNCSTSQLTKFLKKESRALAVVNSHRQEAGLSRLR